MTMKNIKPIKSILKKIQKRNHYKTYESISNIFVYKGAGKPKVRFSQFFLLKYDVF